MQLFYDFLPILLFFVAYKIFGIFVATIVAIFATGGQILLSWIRKHRIPSMQWITFMLILVMGGATLVFHDERFIKLKPTVIYGVFALAFLGSHVVGDRLLIHRLLSEKITLPHTIWRRLNISWALFFCVQAVLNLYVVEYFSTDVWVDFKLFGTLGLTLLFIVLQSAYMMRHLGTKPKSTF